ncbi:MAG: hypothetical protein DCC55_13410 [Chloroflexi bacterium]|nr:MAG: hypothetical protein DCC55_13410 [Chloroflexota bacterium]
MAYYLVRARPKTELLGELADKLKENAFLHLRPFGQSLSQGLNSARWESDGVAIWEEEDYCSPPLAMERAAVLDRYFDEITVERVARDEGWARVATLPLVFPDIAQPTSQ